MKIYYYLMLAALCISAHNCMTASQAPAQQQPQTAGKIIDHELDAELFEAVEKNGLSTIQKLFSQAAVPDINAKNRWGDTPLMSALLSNYQKVAHELITLGADSNIQNHDGTTALMLAAASGYALLPQLITSGAHLDIQNKNGSTALMLAARNGNTNAVQNLIAAGARLNLKNNKGFTAFQLAHRHKYADTAQLLTPTDRSAEGNNDNILPEATISIDYLLNEELLQAAGNPSPGEMRGDVNFAKMKELFTRNTIPNIEKRNSDESTALILATYHNHPEAVKFLIEKGARVNVKNSKGSSPLMWAAARRSSYITNLLLNANADINAQDKYGRTALMYAVEIGNNNAIIIQQLIAAGADKEIKNSSQQTAYDLAKDKDAFNKAVADGRAQRKAALAPRAREITTTIPTIGLDVSNLIADYAYGSLSEDSPATEKNKKSL